MFIGTKIPWQIALRSGLRNFSTTTECTFDVTPYKLHKLDSGPNERVSVKREEALSCLKEMLRTRRMETTASNMYKEKQIRGFCHLYSGQEAISAGMKAGMVHGDSIITAYRCHGWALACGASIKKVLGELAGRSCGIVYGKGGSMHLYSPSDYFYGGCAIVGAQVPLGAGIALAYQYRNQKNVSFTLYGDGAANQGQLYEALNMAKLWHLPCVFVCENNGYGMGTSAERSSASTEYYTRGDYVPGIWVDAMDVLAVREATKWVGDYCRSGKGPLVMEMATYRYFGHSMSDPGTSYRTRDEIQQVRKLRDPITAFRDKLITQNLATEEEIKAMEKDVRKEVDTALAEAMQSPEPPIDLLHSDVYVNTPDLKIRGVCHDNVIAPKAAISSQLMTKSA